MLFVSLAITTISTAQQWRIENNIGYAIGETKNFKKIMLATETRLGYEMNIGTNLYFNLAVGIGTLKFNNIDTSGVNVFTKKHFISLPISIKKYYSLSRAAQGYIDFGIYGNYYFLDKKEYRSIDIDETASNRNLGYNFGIAGTVGYKRTITKTISFDLAICGQIDYLFKYHNESEQIKTNKRLLGISFYKKLN